MIIDQTPYGQDATDMKKPVDDSSIQSASTLSNST